MTLNGRNNVVKSIFDLEKRTDLKKECLKIEKYFQRYIIGDKQST